MQVGNMAVFAYLIGCPETGEGLVVDPAAGIDQIMAEANANKINIRYIVNTHGHVDHISGNAEMKNRTNADIVVHGEDASMLVSTPGMVLRMFGAKPSPPADMTVKDGDTIEIGTIKLKVLHTPGHTPGSICIYLDRNGKRLLFAQDLHGPLLEEFGSNLSDWDRSTHRLLDLDADILCEGHFGIYKTKKEVKDYILSFRRQFGVG